MAFSIILILVLGAIAYFHYAQGCFSATLSAIIAALSAVIAVGYHENMVEGLLAGKMADYAHGMSLAVIYAGVYIVLRLITDAVVPGYVFLGVLPDKVGAGVMGFTAAVFPVGILALTAQSLPFDAQILGYSRMDVTGLRDEGVFLPSSSGGRTQDALVRQELKDRRLDPSKDIGLILPVDRWVVSLTSKVSAGSMSGKRSLASVHPDLPFQLFANRLGIQTGAKKVAYSASGSAVTVNGVWFMDSAGSLAQIDGELESIRPSGEAAALEKNLKVQPGEILLAVRITVSRDASDKDSNVRFSPASVRINAGGKNYFPIATLHHTIEAEQKLAISQRADDHLILPGDGSVDLLFAIPADDICPEAADSRAASAPDANLLVRPGTFLEFKRLARADLSAKPLAKLSDHKPIEGTTLKRKNALQTAIDKALGIVRNPQN